MNNKFNYTISQNASNRKRDLIRVSEGEMVFRVSLYGRVSMIYVLDVAVLRTFTIYYRITTIRIVFKL